MMSNNTNWLHSILKLVMPQSKPIEIEIRNNSIKTNGTTSTEQTLKPSTISIREMSPKMSTISIRTEATTHSTQMFPEVQDSHHRDMKIARLWMRVASQWMSILVMSRELSMPELMQVHKELPQISLMPIRSIESTKRHWKALLLINRIELELVNTIKEIEYK